MKNIEIRTKSNFYNVYFESFLSCNEGKTGDFFNEILVVNNDRKLAIISDDNVYHHYGEVLKKDLIKSGYRVLDFTFKHGEKSKNIDTVLELSSKLLQNNFNRNDMLVALGGGVVGDVVGFLASIYMRGIEYVQIPTSLIAQVDSSIGAKVGVNTEFGKNLIGSFYAPKAVLIDVKVLETMSIEHLKDGMGEVIKYSLIDEEVNLEDIIFGFEDDNHIRGYILTNALDIVYKCVISKKKYIENDEKDYGIRRILNFGHTLGHVMEKVNNYKYPHGQCVAMGMYLITLVSEKMGLTNTENSNKVSEIIKKILKTWDLFDLNLCKDVYLFKNYIKIDKKNNENGLNIVVLESIGKPSIKIIQIDVFMEELLKVFNLK